MSTDDGMEDPLGMLPERYRSLFWSLGSTVASGALLILDLGADGERPLGGIELVTLLVSLGVNAAVWWPKSHVAKLLAAIAGAMALSWTAAVTDDHVTMAEIGVIVFAVAQALGLSVQPNARVVRGEVVESPVPTRVEPTTGLPAGSTYMNPRDADLPGRPDRPADGGPVPGAL